MWRAMARNVIRLGGLAQTGAFLGRACGRAGRGRDAADVRRSQASWRGVSGGWPQPSAIKAKHPASTASVLAGSRGAGEGPGAQRIDAGQSDLRRLERILQRRS